MSRIGDALVAAMFAVVVLVATRDLAADLFWSAPSPEELARMPEASLAPPGARRVERDIFARHLSVLLASPGQLSERYATDAPFGDTADYYTKELVARGWDVERLTLQDRVLYGIGACQGVLRLSVLDTSSLVPNTYAVYLSTKTSGGTCPVGGRPWRSFVVFVFTASFATYIVGAWRARTNALRRRGATIATHGGVASWIASLAWVPYAVAVIGPEPEIEPPLTIVWIGLGLIVIGVALAIWARVTLGRHFDVLLEVHGDHEIVRRGPYAFVRHPVYAGLALHYIGACLALGDLALAVGTVVVTLPALYLRARAEETLLREHFGADYDAYAREVPMLVPWRMT